jgi:hypothetical protein
MQRCRSCVASRRRQPAAGAAALAAGAPAWGLGCTQALARSSGTEPTQSRGCSDAGCAVQRARSCITTCLQPDAGCHRQLRPVLPFTSLAWPVVHLLAGCAGSNVRWGQEVGGFVGQAPSPVPPVRLGLGPAGRPGAAPFLRPSFNPFLHRRTQPRSPCARIARLKACSPAPRPAAPQRPPPALPGAHSPRRAAASVPWPRSPSCPTSC